MQEFSRESIVCPGCGCLCDDLDLTFSGGNLVEAANVCRWGVSRFLPGKKFHPHKKRRRLVEPQVRRQGLLQTVSYEEALEQAAAILTQARRPLIYGLTNVGCRAQEAALALARQVGARLEPADLAFMAPFFQSLKKHGFYLAPLEVIRDQAEAVLFWGGNPLHSAPRHLVRYSVFARGRFTERGLEDRQVAAVDIHRSEMAGFCHLFVEVLPGQDLALLQGMMARLTGEEMPGVPVKGAGKLAEFLAKASFRAIFCGRGASYGPATEFFDLMGELAARLNQENPLVLLPLTGDFNSAGLYHLLLMEMGGVGAPDFGAASPLLHTTPVAFREVDAILVAGADLWWFLSEPERRDLQERRIPLVLLGPWANRTSAQAQVILPVAPAGVEADEVAYRMDGLPVVLKKIVPSYLPTDQQVLRDMGLFL